MHTLSIAKRHKNVSIIRSQKLSVQEAFHPAWCVSTALALGPLMFIVLIL